MEATMMKKRVSKLAIAGLLVGCLTIGGIGTVAMASGNAYQDYKNAALQTVSARNMTVSTSLNVKEDAAVLIAGDTITQTDGKNSYSSSKMQVNGETVDLEQAQSADKIITRNGDEYTSTTLDSRYSDYDRENLSNSSSSVKLMGMVTDLLVGDVKTHFTTSGDTITVNLEGAQIPELVNVAASAMVEQSAASKNKTQYPDEVFGDVLQNLSITQNVKVKSISLTGKVESGYLSDSDITIVLTGTDSAGTSHEVELKAQSKVSDVGSTSVNTIDTAGKTVTESARNYRG